MELLGIRFEVQSKKKSGVVGRRDDVTSIGLWDPEDSTLDWKTFKTYLSQNLGILDDISVVYVDSEGDELPIESECEFQEALKFAKDRARQGRETVLKVDRQGSSLTLPTTSKSSDNVLSKLPAVRSDKAKSSKSCYKTLHKVIGTIDVRPGQEEKKIKIKKISSCGDRQMPEQDKMELRSQITENMKTKADNVSTCSLTGVVNEEKAPQWFRKYMQKMKSEMITEITALVLRGVQQMLERPPQNLMDAPCSTPKPKKKKKIVDDNSSDDGLETDSRDQKLLRKIEKLHKREKKFEKKLDSKLEKLETKTKKLMEKKSMKAKIERTSEKKAALSSRKKNNDVTHLMDALVLNDNPKTEIRIKSGMRFTKIWEIMNAGTVPWTDKTELRQSWSTTGLVSEKNVIKCPTLQPGEKGLIAVNFRAPEYPGICESYWHIYHKGERFGHWIGCTVVVEPNEEQCDSQPDKELVDENKNQAEHPVDLTVKSKVEQPLNCSPNSAECGANIAETKQTTPKLKDPEYVSESDSDNLSIISGTVSLSSESEEDENFVVVQMPACFLCDVPLGSVDTVPVVLKENKKKFVSDGDHFEKYPKSVDMIQLSSEKSQDFDQQCKSVWNLKSGNTAEEAKLLILEGNEESLSSEQQNQHMVKVTESLVVNFSNDNVNENPGTTIEIPEIPCSKQPSPRTVTVSDNHFVQFSNNNPGGNLGMSAERLQIPSCKQQNQRKITVKQGDLFVQVSNDNMNGMPARDPEISISGSDHEMESPRRVFAVDTEGHCRVDTVQTSQSVKFDKSSDKVYAVDMEGHCMPIEITYFGGRTEPSATSTTHSTTNSSSSSVSSNHHTENPTNQQKPSPTHNCSNGSTQSPVHDPLGNVIHILPETLVSGAVNVATSAFSTAKAVLSNLRSRQPGDLTDWNWSSTGNGGGIVTGSSDRSTTESLNLLVEMGFTNKVLNVLLLQRYNNDVAKVVGELLNYDEHGYRRIAS